MKLAFITQDFIPEIGGIQTYSLELSKRLNTKCEKFCLICPTKNNSDDTDLDFSVIRLKSSNTLMYRKVGAGIKTASKVIGKIDATFHVQWQTVPQAIKARNKGLISKVFVASHARELLFNPFGKGFLGKRYQKRMKKLLSKVDHFFPVSEYTKSLLMDMGVEESKITIVINGTNPEQFYPISKNELPNELNFEGPVLLTVSRLVKRKGIEDAIRAFSMVVKENKKSKFIIGGEGPQKKELLKLRNELGLEESILFLGKINYLKLNEVYNSCDVFVLPSRTMSPNVEGFGIVFLEANACGKPVIGTNSGGIPSAIIDKETGYIIPENDIYALKEKIEFLFNNLKEAKRIGQQGLQRVQTEANWDSQASKLFNLLESELH